MNIILSTRNPSKVQQIKEVFVGSRISVLALADTAIEGEAVEDGSTLEENALKKARFVWERMNPKGWAVADDTGIFIGALNGAPGVRSARWADETATTEEITKHTLKELAGKTDRSATFRTVVAVISPEGDHCFFGGEVSGKLLEAPRTDPQPKMPYSPIFVPDGTDLVWAEMSVPEENAISHRGKAFRQARAFLETQV